MRVVLAALFLSIRRVQRQRRPDHGGRAAATVQFGIKLVF
jgi:hypothetical protein